MTGPGESLFSREEVLEGLPARRATALLFLIESRTAFLLARSRQAMERFLTEDAARERERAFVEAFALGRDVAAYIHQCDEMLQLGSAALFCLRYPNHPYTQQVGEIAARITGVNGSGDLPRPRS